MTYNYYQVITWFAQVQPDYENLKIFLECCLQLEIDSEDLQTCQE